MKSWLLTLAVTLAACNTKTLAVPKIWFVTCFPTGASPYQTFVTKLQIRTGYWEWRTLEGKPFYTSVACGAVEYEPEALPAEVLDMIIDGQKK